MFQYDEKKTVRLISCIIAGILVAAMVFSMIASGLVLCRCGEQ